MLSEQQQRGEDRRQRTEGRKTEVGNQRSEVGYQRTPHLNPFRGAPDGANQGGKEVRDDVRN